MTGRHLVTGAEQHRCKDIENSLTEAFFDLSGNSKYNFTLFFLFYFKFEEPKFNLL